MSIQSPPCPCNCGWNNPAPALVSILALAEGLLNRPDEFIDGQGTWCTVDKRARLALRILTGSLCPRRADEENLDAQSGHRPHYFFDSEDRWQLLESTEWRFDDSKNVKSRWLCSTAATFVVEVQERDDKAPSVMPGRGLVIDAQSGRLAMELSRPLPVHWSTPVYSQPATLAAFELLSCGPQRVEVVEVECETCGGAGQQVYGVHCLHETIVEEYDDCPTCHGTGKRKAVEFDIRRKES